MKMGKVSLFLFALLALCVVSLSKRQYFFIDVPKNWTEAQSYCRQTYTDLATVDDMNDLKNLNSTANALGKSSQTVWIGLYDDVNSWRWSDTSVNKTNQMEFRNWIPGEPNNTKSNEHCVTMEENGYWSDLSCNSLRPSVCAKVTGTYVGFFLISTQKSWSAAQSYCREHHTDLASVTSMEENQRVAELIPAGQEIWIGLSRESWKWSDGSNYTFGFWKDGEPNNYMFFNESCTAMLSNDNAIWEDRPCTNTLPFFCYSVPVHKQVVRLRLQGSSSVDMNDPTVLKRLQEQLQQKLKDQGVTGDVKLSWRKQADGKTFHKEKNGKNKPKSEL